MDHNERHLLIIGKTGTGKSSAGNAILGFPAFNTDLSAQSVTKFSQISKTERFGKKLVVVDTPGYSDGNMTDTEILEEISRWHLFASPGVHAIIFMVEIGRFTKEDEKNMDFFMKVFGEQLKNHLIVVFSHKNKLETKNKTVDDYVKTLDASTNLRNLIDLCKNRYTAIGDGWEGEDRTLEVNKILSMVEDIAGKDGKNYYSSEYFQYVKSVIEENEGKCEVETTKHQREKYTMEDIEDVLDIMKKQTIENDIKNDNNLLTNIALGVGSLMLASHGYTDIINDITKIAPMVVRLIGI